MRKVVVGILGLAMMVGCAGMKVKKEACPVGSWIKVPQQEFWIGSKTESFDLFISASRSGDVTAVAFFGVDGKYALLAVAIDRNGNSVPDGASFMNGKIRLGRNPPFAAMTHPRPILINDDVKHDFAKALEYWEKGIGCFSADEWEKQLKETKHGV